MSKLKNKRTYITKDEVTKVLNHLKDKGLYRQYVIVLALTELNIKFVNMMLLTWDKLYIMLADKPLILNEFKNMRNIMEEKYKSVSGHDRNRVIQMTLRGFNKCMKEQQRYMGLWEIADFSTKLFNTRMMLHDEEVYGYIEYRREKRMPEVKKDTYIYLLKQTHRDVNISKLLTDKKIGLTNSPRNRKSSLTLGPVGIECIKLWKVDVSFTGKVEKILHKKFVHRNIVGEWFEDKENDLINLMEGEFETFKLMGIDVENIDPSLMSKYK